MLLLELFCGTKSFTKEFIKIEGNKSITLDFEERFEPDICIDILKWDYKNTNLKPDIIWSSPPCTCFSVASIKYNWKKENNVFIPQSEKTKKAILILEKTIEIINYFKPKYYFIENPRGIMRKMKILETINRNTITYCTYGENRMKPTDIWTNCLKWKHRKPCKNGCPNHERAPRGSKTGVQGQSKRDRIKIPPELCQEIISIII